MTCARIHVSVYECNSSPTSDAASTHTHDSMSLTVDESPPALFVPLRDRESGTHKECSRKVLFWISCVATLASISLSIALGVALSQNSSQSENTNSPCANLCRPVCVTKGSTCFKNCVNLCNKNGEFVRPASLGEWIAADAIQHVGITTSNLEKSVKFYTEVLGGVEVIGAGGDGWKGDDVYQLLMQAAVIRGGGALKWAANITAHGTDSMDARYVSFGSMIIELLDYHSDEAKLGRSLFPKFSDSTVAPSVAGNLHVSFNVRPSKDLNEFVTELEKKAHAAGYNDVICNRLVPVEVGPDGRPILKPVPASKNSFTVHEGSFQGWSLAYCKGPFAEQLEFNQVVGKAKKVFDDALERYLSEGTVPYQ